jgi:hypothetical protein
VQTLDGRAGRFPVIVYFGFECLVLIVHESSLSGAFYPSIYATKQTIRFRFATDPVTLR